MGRIEADRPTGADGHRDERRRRRSGRHADGRHTRHRNRRAGVPAQRRRHPGRELRAGARACRVRHARPERPLPQENSRWRIGDHGRHDRARSRQRGHGPHDFGQARRCRLSCQRHESVSNPRFVRRSDADLCTLRSWRGRHRLGADPARRRRLQAGRAVEIPQWRRLGADLSRQRLCRARERHAERRRLQETDRGLQRRAHRQHCAFACVRPLRLRAGAPMGHATQAVRPPAVRFPGPAMEIRRHENQARCGATADLPRGRQRHRWHSLGGRHGHRESLLQPGRFRYLQ